MQNQSISILSMKFKLWGWGRGYTALRVLLGVHFQCPRHQLHQVIHFIHTFPRREGINNSVTIIMQFPPCIPRAFSEFIQVLISIPSCGAVLSIATSVLFHLTKVQSPAKTPQSYWLLLTLIMQQIASFESCLH